MRINSELDNLFFEALKLVSADDYKKAKHIIQSILNNKSNLEKLNIDHWQYIADMSLVMGDFELAKNAYTKAENIPGVAFTLILLGDLKAAKLAIANAQPSPVTNWCNFLIELFSEGNVKKLPLFFTLQHFLEFTVYHLLLANRQDFLDLLLKNLDKLLQVNLDSEKIVGKAYFHFGKLDEALKFLNLALKRNQYDGEVFFVLGQLHMQRNQFREALSMLHNALVFLPEHYPTKMLIEKANALL